MNNLIEKKIKIENMIYEIKEHRVMLDRYLAKYKQKELMKQLKQYG